MVCLSYGERGEIRQALARARHDAAKVKAARRAEAENAARALGVHEIEFFDLGDYPLRVTEEAKFRLVGRDPRGQPGLHAHPLALGSRTITDHLYATQIALECRMIAQAWGHNPGEKVIGAPQLYLFEPHQTEQMRLEARRLARHHAGLGQEARRHRVHGGPGASLGVLHARRRRTAATISSATPAASPADGDRNTPRASSRCSPHGGRTLMSSRGARDRAGGRRDDRRSRRVRRRHRARGAGPDRAAGLATCARSTPARGSPAPRSRSRCRRATTG